MVRSLLNQVGRGSTIAYGVLWGASLLALGVTLPVALFLSCSSPTAPSMEQLREGERAALQSYLLGRWEAYSSYTVGSSRVGVYRGFLKGSLFLAAFPREGRQVWAYRIVFTDVQGHYTRWFSLPTDTTDVEEGTWKVLPPERERELPLLVLRVEQSRFHPEERGVSFRLPLELRPPKEVKIGTLWWARL